MSSQNIWPDLPFSKCSDTLETLHMKMQVIGKIKLALTPFINHWWNVALHLTAQGMTTGIIPYNNTVFEINFDFKQHNVTINSSNNKTQLMHLHSGSVAEFYKQLMSALNEMGISVTINKVPSEVPDPVPCDIDLRSIYHKDYVYDWWRILIQSGMVFERFRSGFRGKMSPVHFFWGSFDLCGTFFSGSMCSPPEHSGVIMRFSENEENFTYGFWAGSKSYPKPAFYSYIYPQPEGIESLKINPVNASFNTQQKLFLLDYDDVRESANPGELILEFLNSTYQQSADLSGWDTEALKAEKPRI